MSADFVESLRKVFGLAVSCIGLNAFSTAYAADEIPKAEYRKAMQNEQAGGRIVCINDRRDRKAIISGLEQQPNVYPHGINDLRHAVRLRLYSNRQKIYDEFLRFPLNQKNDPTLGRVIKDFCFKDQAFDEHLDILMRAQTEKAPKELKQNVLYCSNESGSRKAAIYSNDKDIFFKTDQRGRMKFNVLLQRDGETAAHQRLRVDDPVKIQNLIHRFCTGYNPDPTESHEWIVEGDLRNKKDNTYRSSSSRSSQSGDIARDKQRPFGCPVTVNIAGCNPY